MNENKVSIVKDKEREQPIPSRWRPIFSHIVDSLVKKDYSLSRDVAGAAIISDETASQIKGYIDDYGEELIQLSEETWNTSVCIWTGDHWDVLIDLWTAGEGRSDMVLSAKVFEVETGHRVDVEMVYVP